MLVLFFLKKKTFDKVVKQRVPVDGLKELRGDRRDVRDDRLGPAAA